MQQAVLFRTNSGSVPVQPSFITVGSPRISVPVNDAVTGVFSSEKSVCLSPRISLNLEANFRRGIRRTASESDMLEVRPVRTLSRLGSRSFPARIPEETESNEVTVVSFGGIGSLTLTEDDRIRSLPEEEEETGFPGGGIGKDRKRGGRGGGEGADGNAEGGSKMWEYYENMLKSNPSNSLLLRNYARYLHEVERDTVKAEEYYGRAILASPGDGEVLSLYANLIWETQRDDIRAKSYFDQAIHASPDDCMVLGSYARFMWEAEEDEEEEEVRRESRAVMVEAF